jgi:hypothetical protein
MMEARRGEEALQGAELLRPAVFPQQKKNRLLARAARNRRLIVTANL